MTQHGTVCTHSHVPNWTRSHSSLVSLWFRPVQEREAPPSVGCLVAVRSHANNNRKGFHTDIARSLRPSWRRLIRPCEAMVLRPIRESHDYIPDVSYRLHSPGSWSERHSTRFSSAMDNLTLHTGEFLQLPVFYCSSLKFLQRLPASQPRVPLS